MNALTDDTGMLQHAIFTIPNRAEGYTTDDNARALIFTVLLAQIGNGSEQWEDKSQRRSRSSANPDFSCRYLAFLEHAFNPANGRFRNFLGYDRQWNEAAGSEDCSRARIVGPGNGSGPIRQSGIEERCRAFVRVFASGGGGVL